MFSTLLLPALSFVAASWIHRWAVFTFKTQPFCTALFLSLIKLLPSTERIERNAWLTEEALLSRTRLGKRLYITVFLLLTDSW